MTIDSKSLTVFFRNQGIYLFIALVIGAIFWAMSEPIHPFTVILYSLCIGNFLSPHAMAAPAVRKAGSL